MPELPEVETVIRQLRDSGVEGLEVIEAKSVWPKTAPDAPQLIGRAVELIDRRGKYIVIRLDQMYLLIHLRMSGKLLFATAPGPYTRAWLRFSDGRLLCFDDPRKFGRWYVVEDPLERVGYLGPEALDITADQLGQRVQKARPIKSVLLDQAVIAGLGNIYVDEALFEAAIHPEREANLLNISEIERLHVAIVNVLQRGIAHGGTSLGKGPSNYTTTSGEAGGHQYQLQVFRRTGEPCLRCGSKIIRMVVAQRGTHVCTTCQKS